MSQNRLPTHEPPAHLMTLSEEIKLEGSVFPTPTVEMRPFCPHVPPGTAVVCGGAARLAGRPRRVRLSRARSKPHLQAPCDRVRSFCAAETEKFGAALMGTSRTRRLLALGTAACRLAPGARGAAPYNQPVVRGPGRPHARLPSRWAAAVLGKGITRRRLPGRLMSTAAAPSSPHFIYF